MMESFLSEVEQNKPSKKDLDEEGFKEELKSIR